MTEPVVFTSASPRFAIPLLFAGQAQKEVFVNEAHALIDALLHPAVEGETDDPPIDPAEGECWLVGAAPNGAWAGHGGKLACRQAGEWVLSTPRDGMRIFDRSRGQAIRYRDRRQRAATPAAPVGRPTVDTAARATVTALA